MRSNYKYRDFLLIEDDLSEACVLSRVPVHTLDLPDVSFCALASSGAGSHGHKHLCDRKRIPIPNRIPARNDLCAGSPQRIETSFFCARYWLHTDAGGSRSRQQSWSEAKRTRILQGAGGAGHIPIEFVSNVGLGFNGLESRGYEFSTADLQPLEASLGVKVDGILDMNFSDVSW